MNISENDIDLILREISKSNNILPYSKKELLKFINTKKVLIVRDDNQIIGLSAYKHISHKWIELSLLLVFLKYRNRGYGKKMYSELSSLLRDDNLYCCSRNPIVQQWLTNDGFRQVLFHKLPIEIILNTLKDKFKLYKLVSFLKNTSIMGWKHYLKIHN